MAAKETTRAALCVSFGNSSTCKSKASETSRIDVLGVSDGEAVPDMVGVVEGDGVEVVLSVMEAVMLGELVTDVEVVPVGLLVEESL